MKILNSILLLAQLFLLASAACSAEIPQLRGHVNDYAGLLSPAAKQALEERLARFEAADSTQIVVLTVPTLSGEPLEDFSIRVAETWKIGRKGKDNGVILLLVRDERKIRIEVGRGLEGVMTDLVSGRIIRNDIRPHFSRGDFDGGVAAGVAAIMKAARGEFQAEKKAPRHAGTRTHQLLTYLVLFMVACVFLGTFSRILGGLAGGALLPATAFVMFPGIGLAVLAGLAVAGFLAGLFLAGLFGAGGGFGGWGGGPFIGGWGGGFGGGSGGDGGFSGGGGDFGGGGASGDW